MRSAAVSGDPLRVLRGRGGILQAEIIASYRPQGATHILDVSAVQSTKEGQSCRLIDALDQMEARAVGEAARDSVAGEPAEEALSLLEQAGAAKSAGDPARAVVLYQRAAALLAADPAQRDVFGLAIRAELQRDIARTMRDAGVDDPCATLDLGQDYLAQAREQLPASGAQTEREILNATAGSIATEQRRNRCAPSGPPPERGQPDAALAGHYYLSGVMETGSELRLTADGRFDWYMSYGAVDQIAKGRWGRKGRTVTLAADPPSAETPLFRADARAEWNDLAERRLRERHRTQEGEAIAARCPWSIAAAMAAPAILPGDRPTPGPAERAKAAEARSVAEAARDDAGDALAQAVVRTASAADRAAADAAMSAWYAAQEQMEAAHRAADLPLPDIGSPAMPTACRLPETDEGAEIPASQWQRGIAVVVGDPAREMRLSRVAVTFVYSDGHREETETSRGGWAFAPLRKGAFVDQLVLAMPQRTQTLTLPPLAEGIQTVIVDTQQIVEPPFEVLRLEIRGGDLIPQDMPRGRYSRN